MHHFHCDQVTPGSGAATNHCMHLSFKCFQCKVFSEVFQSDIENYYVHYLYIVLHSSVHNLISPFLFILIDRNTRIINIRNQKARTSSSYSIPKLFPTNLWNLKFQTKNPDLLFDVL